MASSNKHPSGLLTSMVIRSGFGEIRTGDWRLEIGKIANAGSVDDRVKAREVNERGCIKQ